MCALCGDSFMAEILLGRSVQTVEIVGMDKDVCLHEKCMKALKDNGPDWHTLPDGPLRRAYATAACDQPASVPAVPNPDDQPASPQRA
jgi:hypothetical protein